MNVFIVSPTLNHGGAERVASLWAEGFAERGHKVYFVANKEVENVYSLGKGVHLLPLTNPYGSKIIRYIGAVKRLRRYYKEYRPDVIIGVMYACSLLAKLAELGIGIPVINTEHSAFEQPRNFPMLLTDRIAKYWLNYLYDGITILTKVDMDIIKNRFKNLYLLPNPTFLLPLGIVPEKQNVVFAAGRIDAWGCKGFDVLLKAWERVINDDKEENKHQDWKLQIAGDGKDESFKYLMGLIPDGNWQPISDSTNESETRNMGSGFSGWHSSKYSIEFLGFRKDVAQLYGTASVFVLSSRYEGFGMVLVEAMSQGCAPVACDYKGRQKEILGDCGICCKPDDVEALAASIKKMMVDDAFRKQSQGDALRRSKDFSKERIIDKWESILSSVLSKQS